MIMNRTQHGMTVIEALGALVVAMTLLVGLSAMIDSSLENVEGQQAALYQEKVVNAASRFITANYKDLVNSTADGTTVATITLAQLRSAGFLPNGFADTNAFNQSTCVLVRQANADKLDALVVTYGGTAIPEREVPKVAMQAGQGGGYISAVDPGTARGASWSLNTTNYRNVPCGGAGAIVLTNDAADVGGHLVSSLFFDGPGQLRTDFLYRNAVPGRPELNEMNMPIHMAPATVPGTNAQAEVDTTDSRCEDNSHNGKIAIDESGRVLSCQDGMWRRQGFSHWKDPVETYESFAELPAEDIVQWDVRMVKSLNRPFTWDGTSWVALAVDQGHNLVMEGKLTTNRVKLNRTVARNDPCSEDGRIALDTTGMMLSCQSGLWRSPLSVRLADEVYRADWTVYADDGTPQDSWLDLSELRSSLPRSRPLYLTGYTYCYATGFPRAYAYVNFMNAEGDEVYASNYSYAGACMSRPDDTGNGVLNKGTIPLQVIPEDAVRLHFHTEVQSGAAPGDYVRLFVKIYSSE